MLRCLLWRRGSGAAAPAVVEPSGCAPLTPQAKFSPDPHLLSCPLPPPPPNGRDVSAVSLALGVRFCGRDAAAEDLRNSNLLRVERGGERPPPKRKVNILYYYVL